MKIKETFDKIAKDPKSMFLTDREVDRFIKEIMQLKKTTQPRKAVVRNDAKTMHKRRIAVRD